MNDWDRMKERFRKIAGNVKPIQHGEVGVWYDNAGHFCDVIWLTASAYFHPTGHNQVMALIDDDENLFGFKVDATHWFDNGKNEYTTINLRAKLTSFNDRNGLSSDPEEQPDSPMVNGVINVRYDSSQHYFDVLWASRDTELVETDNSHILAAVDTDEILCGFRVINIDQLSDDEHGLAHTRLKTGMGIRAI